MRMRGYDNKCTAGDNRPNEMGELNRRALRLLAGSFFWAIVQPLQYGAFVKNNKHNNI